MSRPPEGGLQQYYGLMLLKFSKPSIGVIFGLSGCTFSSSVPDPKHLKWGDNIYAGNACMSYTLNE